MADTKLLFCVILYIVTTSALISYFASEMGISGVAGLTVSSPDIGEVSSIPIIGGVISSGVFIVSFLANMAGLLTYSAPEAVLPRALQVLFFAPAECILGILVYRHIIPTG